MKRIILHWTGGTNQPNNTDYEHYHYLINGNGLIIKGKHSVHDNRNCTDGNYAAHCGGGNTGSIGVAMCGMKDFNGNPNSTKYALTRKQCEATFELLAKLCKDYGIPITPQTVLTHYEFGQAHPKTSSYGKIDIIFLPPFNFVPKNEVGDFIRNKVRWYYQRV